ncbi:hypothetical protein OSTOST_00648 [Ostertagia ostertagi]
MLEKLRRKLHHRDDKLRRQTICEGAIVDRRVPSATERPLHTNDQSEAIIDRRHSPEGRWKGVVFGRKGNSRSGHFQSSAVKIIDKPESGK